MVEERFEAIDVGEESVDLLLMLSWDVLAAVCDLRSLCVCTLRVVGGVDWVGIDGCEAERGGVPRR